MENRTRWSIDPAHSEMGFKVKHLMISYVKGTFNDFESSIYTIGDDFTTAEISVWMDPSSVDTGDNKRDKHLVSPEFFDATNYKEISFNDGKLERSAKGEKLELTGNLSIKGITKKVKFDVEYGGKRKDPWGNEKVGFSITGKINRKDWGLTWNTLLEAGGEMIGEEVIINCEVQLIKQKGEEMKMKAEASKDERVNV